MGVPVAPGAQVSIGIVCNRCSHAVRPQKEVRHVQYMCWQDLARGFTIANPVCFHMEAVTLSLSCFSSVPALLSLAMSSALETCSSMRPSVDISVGGDASSLGVGAGAARTEFRSTVAKV